MTPFRLSHNNPIQSLCTLATFARGCPYARFRIEHFDPTDLHFLMASGSDPGFSSPHRFQTVFKKAPFSSLGRQIVLNVYFKLRVETPAAPYHEIVRRTAELTGVGYATIFRWKKLVEKSALTGAPSVPSPIRTRRERPPATPSSLDSFHHQALRLMLHGFFRRNECPTLHKASPHLYACACLTKFIELLARKE